MQPLLRGFKIDNLRQQLQVNLINREISEESARATVTQTLANVRNAYWDLVFAQSAVDVAQRASELADKLVEDNQARVEVGTLAPLDIVQAQAEAATRRQNLPRRSRRADRGARAEALHRQRHRRSAVAADHPARSICRRSSRRRPTSKARCAARSTERTDMINARKNLDTNDINIQYFKNQSMPALDLNASYGAQGLGRPRLPRSGSRRRQPVTGTDPRAAIPTRSACSQSRLPELERHGHAELPDWRQPGRRAARARAAQRNQSQTRMRALEVQIAAEVTNAALTVQSNLKRVEAATARASSPRSGSRPSRASSTSA